MKAPTLSKKAVACHEAGHAVVAAVLGIIAVDRPITIVKDGFEEGSVEFSRDGSNDAWRKWDVRHIRKAILATYAGPAASIKLEPGLNLLEEGGWFEFDMYGAHDLCKWMPDTHSTLFGPVIEADQSSF